MEAFKEPDSNVTPIEQHWRPKAERINGVKIHLGQMSCEQLVTLESYCRQRIDEAHLDLLVVEDYLYRLYPDGAA